MKPELLRFFENSAKTAAGQVGGDNAHVHDKNILQNWATLKAWAQDEGIVPHDESQSEQRLRNTMGEIQENNAYFAIHNRMLKRANQDANNMKIAGGQLDAYKGNHIGNANDPVNPFSFWLILNNLCDRFEIEFHTLAAETFAGEEHTLHAYIANLYQTFFDNLYFSDIDDFYADEAHTQSIAKLQRKLNEKLNIQAAAPQVLIANRDAGAAPKGKEPAPAENPWAARQKAWEKNQDLGLTEEEQAWIKREREEDALFTAQTEAQIALLLADTAPSTSTIEKMAEGTFCDLPKLVKEHFNNSDKDDIKKSVLKKLYPSCYEYYYTKGEKPTDIDAFELQRVTSKIVNHFSWFNANHDEKKAAIEFILNTNSPQQKAAKALENIHEPRKTIAELAKEYSLKEFSDLEDTEVGKDIKFAFNKKRALIKTLVKNQDFAWPLRGIKGRGYLSDATIIATRRKIIIEILQRPELFEDRPKRNIGSSRQM